MENIATAVTARCPIRTTLELIGGKWKLMIIFQLSQNPLRLSELKKAIPDISEKMLIQELKKLVDSQLVTRKNFGTVPPRVSYYLNDIGHKVLPILYEMKAFSLLYEEEMVKKEVSKLNV